jgi:hypothetical protein
MSDTERVWPVAVNGIYPDDGAEIIRMGDYPGARAEIRVLQVGPDKWVSSILFNGGGYDHSDEMEADYIEPTRTKAIWIAADAGYGQLRWLSKYHENKDRGVEAILRWFDEQRDACQIEWDQVRFALSRRAA